MESTGFPNCIQISKATADLLIAAGKQAWLKPRTDMINAKGKGLMQTYFLEISRNVANSSNGGSSNADLSVPDDTLVEQPGLCSNIQISTKNARLVDWIAETLIVCLKEIAVSRSYVNQRSKRHLLSEAFIETNISSSVLDEVKEIVTLPSACMREGNKLNSKTVDVDPIVGQQLRHYLSKISLMYPENPCKLLFEIQAFINIIKG
jgi:hypothetical protein